MNKDVILGIVRHVLTAGGGALVTKGVVTTPDLDTLVGAVIAIAGVVWSILAKKKAAPTA